MKKQLFIIFIIIFMKLLLPVRPYLECNHLTIITKIEVKCNNDFDITYYETIPVKEDNGITYHTKKYHTIHPNFLLAIKIIENNKNIYKEKAKIITECDNKEDIIRILKET